MKTSCKAPKCHETRSGCACPNSWIEYLAKTGNERKAAGLPKLSSEVMKTRYQALVKRGTLLPKISPCNSNATLLCEWNSARQRNVLTKPSKRTKKVQSSAKRSLRFHESVKANDGNPKRMAFLRRRSKDVLSPFEPWLMERFKKYQHVRDTKLGVFINDPTGKPLMFTHTAYSPEDAPLVARSIWMQKQWHKRLGKLVPKIHFSGVFKRKNPDMHVLITVTDRIDGDLESMLRSHPMQRPVMRDIAKQLKAVDEAMHKHELVHGYHGLRDIAYQLTRDGFGLRLRNFTHAALNLESESDRWFLLNDIRDLAETRHGRRYCSSLQEALHDVNFPIPSGFTSGMSDEQRDEFTALQERSMREKNATFKAPPLKCLAVA